MRWPLVLAVLGCADDTPDGMIAFSAATFTIGCDASAPAGCDADAMPPHAVSLSAFALDRTEVTQARYQQCIAAGRCTPPRCAFAPATTPQLPVACVTWAQADAFCRFAGGRLPTEAQWEAAARGLEGHTYPWGEQAPDCVRAQYSGCGLSTDMSSEQGTTPLPVGTHPLGATAMGVEDLAGNVAEWVADWYDPNAYSAAPAHDPAGPASGSGRVVRGGSFLGSVASLRGYVRSVYPPDGSDESLGFRCARP